MLVIEFIMTEIVRILCQVTVCLVLTASPVCGSGNSTSRLRTCHPAPQSVLQQQFAYSRGPPKHTALPSLGKHRKHRTPRHLQQDVTLDMLSLEVMSGEVREHTKRQARNNSTAEHNTSPWHCEMKRKWKDMREGTYPRYIETGRCRQTRCFLDMYECRPRKYVVNVLKRSKRRCVPVPQTDSLETRYEEKWRWRKVKVTVGCECVGTMDGRLRALLRGL